jgi:NAD(P)-dependent dehydrogenase (short-subunit alcohol dehydrogenase family)
LLLERLLATPGARIVTMSSTAHKFGRMQFADLQFSRGYRAWAAYGQSKLANLLFTYELQRRLARAGQATLVVAAHPGWARTGLQRTAFQSGLEKCLTGFLGRFLSQDARYGALPLLRAALDPRAQGGAFYGPTGCFELVGRPDRVRSNRRSHDEAAQARLWQVSEQLTGVVYPV